MGSVTIAGNVMVITESLYSPKGKAEATLANFEDLQGTFNSSNTATISITNGDSKRVVSGPFFNNGTGGEDRTIWLHSKSDSQVVIKCSGGDANGITCGITLAPTV